MASDIYINPTAVVDHGAKIGAGTKVWHFSHIMPGAIIGENCNLGQNVFIADGVEIGDGVKIQNNVSLYSGMKCGSHVFIGPSAVFTNVINPRSHVNRRDEYLETIIENGATIGANATIVCGIKIGRYAFIGAGAVVTKDVQSYALVSGVPARHRGWMSEGGMKLIFNRHGKASCSLTGNEYVLDNDEVFKINT